MLAELPELKQRWRALKPEDEGAAELHLADVSRDIVRDFPTVEVRMAADTGFAADVARITCNVVRRRMTGESVENIEQESEGRGPFNKSRRYRDYEGDLELTTLERTILEGVTEETAAAAQPVWTGDVEPVFFCVPRWPR